MANNYFSIKIDAYMKQLFKNLSKLKFNNEIKQSENSPLFIGSKKDFNKYFGGYARNLVQSITKSHKRSIGKCEHCGTADNPLDSAHVKGKERKDIIDNIISKFDKDGVCEISLNVFEKEFIDAHNPIQDTIKILCKECHREYDSDTKVRENIEISSQLVTDDIQVPETEITNEEPLIQERIGQYVRRRMRQLWEEGLINQDEIQRLQSPDYSNNTFNVHYEILRRSSRKRTDDRGYNRYYAQEIIPGYWMCSQWYEYQRELFMEWENRIRNSR